MANTTTRKRATAKKTDETKQAKARQVEEVVEAEERVEEAVAEMPIEKEEKQSVVNESQAEIDSLKEQIEQLKALLKEQAKSPAVAIKEEERVWFLWLANVADYNVLTIGDHGQYGRIVGSVGTFYVPKNELSRVMDAAFRHYMENRWLIVTSGLTEEERIALDVNYKDGEVMDEKMFRRIADMGKDLLDIYPNLCEEHKRMVAGKMHEAYESGKKMNRQLIVDLNSIYPCEAYKDIIERMNEAELGHK